MIGGGIRKRRVTVMALVRYVVTVAALLVLIAVGIYLLFGTFDKGAIWAQLHEMLRLIF